MYQPENHPRLGVCYYPEHWPEDTWETDAARMKALGLSTVRIAEFAWAKMEPEPGIFTWGWLDRAIETLGNAGDRKSTRLNSSHSSVSRMPSSA